VPVTHRELAQKLKRAGFRKIRTTRHPVWFHVKKNLTIPVPSHPGDVPKGTLRTLIREIGITVEEFNRL
jgi:predicted RNA binding protein YcfA (HicA-like mRNA interferase family)